MGRPQFSEDAWEEYVSWGNEDRKVVKKINSLIKDIMRNGAMDGIGEPEALKENYSGFYSRMINKKDRLVYRIIDDDIIEIVKCKGHYHDK